MGEPSIYLDYIMEYGKKIKPGDLPKEKAKEGKVPSTTDTESTKIKKLTEEGEPTESDILGWVDKFLYDVKEGEKTIIKGRPVEIVYVNKFRDPYAHWRPQNLYYVVGKAGDRWFATMYGSDEGLAEGHYSFAFAPERDELPSEDKFLREGPSPYQEEPTEEGKVPATTDTESTKIKKLTEEEEEEEPAGSEEPEMPSEEELEAPPEKEKDTSLAPEKPKKREKPTEVDKEYIGKTEDIHFYMISKGEGEARDDLQIEGFVVKAIQDVEIEEIERSVFLKYILPQLLEEEPEEEELEEPEGSEERGEEREPERELKKPAESPEMPGEVKFTEESKKTVDEAKKTEKWFKNKSEYKKAVKNFEDHINNKSKVIKKLEMKRLDLMLQIPLNRLR